MTVPAAPGRGGPALGDRLPPAASEPGRRPLPRFVLPEGGRMAGFDRAVDDAFERSLRHRQAPDVVFYAASSLGDHGTIWLALAGVQAARRAAGGRTDWRQPLLRAGVGLGLESALVNGPVKWMFRRSRPVHEGPRPLHLRQPRTSSFPSGHATAAFFAAALLRDQDPWWPLYYAIAAVVATSRVHVRIHHASDVVGGVVIGAVLGEAVRHLFPWDTGGAAGSPPDATSGGDTVPSAPDRP